MHIALTENRLTPGVIRESGVLYIPAEGGGFALDEIAVTEERYLNMTVETPEEHSMAFELQVYGKNSTGILEEEPRVTIRFGIMPRYKTNLFIDLNWLDGHILFPGHIPGELKVVCHGSRIRRDEIHHVVLTRIPSHHTTRVIFDDVELSDIAREAASLPDVKLIDELGQYTLKDWPDKTHSYEVMKERLEQAASMAEAYYNPKWSAYGGDTSNRLTEGTGFFSKTKKDGRWYMVDPEGYAFFSAGPDGVRLPVDGRVDGLEPLMEWLPDTEDPVYKEMYAIGGRTWGEVPRGEIKLFSFFMANMYRVFGDSWYEVWQSLIVKQLKNAGMNTVANWSDPVLHGKMPYVTSLPKFPETQHRIFRDFPDVFAPEYMENAEISAKGLLLKKDDPWMIGYFLRNEPNWAFVDNLIIAEEVLRDPEDTYSKRALIQWLKEQYGSIQALNEAWKLSLEHYDDLKQPMIDASHLSPSAKADLQAFSAVMVERYTQIPIEACRKVDPNHMILGMRWAWISDPALIAGWERFDVFSINCYAVDPTPALDNVRNLGVDLPVMIGEFHCGALDGGLTATGLEGVTTQAERGVAYRYYCERVAAHPNGVGCHYFQCYDQFALGRFDGENYNIGLFDVCLKPYAAMIDAVQQCSLAVYDIMSGKRQPVGQLPESIPMIAY